LYEVTAAEYAAIGSTITDEAVDAYWPYVDGKQHVQGVAITKQGRNMLLGTPDALHANAKMNGPYDLTLTATATFQKSYMDIPYAPGATYTIAANLGGYGARLYITLVDVAGTETAPIVTLTDATQSPVIFIAPVGYSKIRAAFSNALTGTFTFKNWQLELGSTPTPFTPAEPQSVILPVALGQIGDVKDSVYSAGTEWIYVERIKKNVALDGSLAWTFDVSISGFKVVKVPAFAGLTQHMTSANSRAIRYDGRVLTPYTGTATTANAYRQLFGDTSFFTTISTDASGWTDTLNPSANAIKALMNGWLAIANNGTSYTSWVSILDGSAPTTNTEAWVAANKAPGWTAWATTDYALASAAAPVVIPNAEGSITLHPGGNQISVETGVIQREKVTPVFNSGANYWEINRTDVQYPASKTSKRLARFVEIYAGADVMPRVWAVNAMGVSGTDNGARAGIPGAYYDTTKDYYVTYIALDKYALTANVTETAATWKTGLGGVVSDLVQDVAELRQENDRQDFADDYIEAKVDNLKLGISNASALPDSIQKFKLTENTGAPFLVNSGSANTLVNTGLYSITNSSVTDLPAAATGILEVEGALQRFTETPSLRTWKRRINAGVWNSWVEDENASRKNVAGGYAGLDTNGDLAIAAIPDSVLQGTLAYAVTTGTYATLAASLTPAPASLTAGLRLTIKTHVASPGPATLNVNGLGAKSIKKPNGNNAALALGGVYTLVYDGTNFILQGEGGEYGTAGAAQVLSGYTVGSEDGLINGSMANNGAGGTVTPTTSVQTKPAGYYSSAITIAAVSAPANKILSDTTIAGVAGTVPIITSGSDPAQGVGLWADGGLAVYPSEGYRKGGSGAGEIKVSVAQLQSADVSLRPENILSGKTIFGTSGTVVKGPTRGTVSTSGSVGSYADGGTILSIAPCPQGFSFVGTGTGLRIVGTSQVQLFDSAGHYFTFINNVIENRTDILSSFIIDPAANRVTWCVNGVIQSETISGNSLNVNTQLSLTIKGGANGNTFNLQGTMLY
ncbi:MULTISPECIES: pyocin knob domain-containing protein, partial [unclassified Paenibacillus]|uniref:pyocin knob domain-containing protein n=2 Tax=unclassified Paenibacillus TaxID=185978 RepID=UPI00240749A9